MKRPYSHMSTSLLPVLSQRDPGKFKSVLDGTYKLKVLNIVDISKPKVKPTEDIDEPENDDEANEIRLNKTNARMLQLDLIDTNKTPISAIEVERIELLSSAKPNWNIYIEGPVEIRCGNIMLEKRHITNVEPPGPGEEIPPLTGNPTISNELQRHTSTHLEPTPTPTPTTVIDIDDEDSGPVIIEDDESTKEPVAKARRDLTSQNKPQVEAVEDWDEADEEDDEDDDCIVID